MGMRGDRGGTGPAPRLRPVVAAIAGATAVGAAAALAARRRRRTPPASPTSTAGPTARGGLAARARDRAPRGRPAAGAPTGRGPGANPAATIPGVDPPRPTVVPPTAGPADRVADRGDADPADRADADPAVPANPADRAPHVVPTPTGRTTDDGSPAPDEASPPATTRRRGSRVAVGLVAVGLVLGGGALVTGAGSDQRAGDVSTADGSPDTRPATTTTLPPPAADQAFGTAAERLTTAGSFSYAGTVSATDVSHVRPMFWLAVSTDVEGQVATSTRRLHEVAVAADGRAAETVTDGDTVWGRRAPSIGGLADQPYAPIPTLTGPGPDGDSASQTSAARGAALLPAWLASATGPVDAGPDEQGRPRFRATIPADVFGAVERERQAVDAAVVLTLDPTGTPVRVEITSAPDGPPLHVVFDIGELGAPVTIEPPTGAAPPE